jgi:hypothetical protein
MNTQHAQNAVDVETMLRELLQEGYSDFLDSLRSAYAYEDAGILTRDKGLVLTFANGAEFQLTIVQSRWGQDTESETLEDDAEADAALWDADLYSR